MRLRSSTAFGSGDADVVAQLLVQLGEHVDGARDDVRVRVVELLAQAVVTQHSLRIMPDFIRGETLARMPAEAGRF